MDASTKAAIKDAPGDCPDCARRLAAQQHALALLRRYPWSMRPPNWRPKSSHVALRAAEPARRTRRAARRRTSRRPRTLLSPAGPWLPAMAGGAAVLALVLALTVSRNPADTGRDHDYRGGTSVSSEAGSAQTASGCRRRPPQHHSPDGARVRRRSLRSPPTRLALSASANARSSAPPQPTGAYLQDRAAMVSSLTQASVPAYFFFDTEDGALVTAEQADTVASQVTAATGLRTMDQDLSSGVKAFAAFVPREDSAAVVDLLRSISDSLQLTVCLEPGARCRGDLVGHLDASGQVLTCRAVRVALSATGRDELALHHLYVAPHHLRQRERRPRRRCWTRRAPTCWW